MFRTASGQTGTDAYINEAAQIKNAQRELDARAARLAAAMAAELADDTQVKFGLISYVSTADASSLRKVIEMYATASNAEYLGRIARGIADPDYVVKHAD